MKIVVGSVVKGLTLKTAVVEWLEAHGHEVVDVGVYDFDTFIKFPSIAERAARVLQQGEAELGILCCGSGTGMALAANKFRGVCAASCESPAAAEMLRTVNDANCLCMGENLVTPEIGKRMAAAFINWKFQDVPGIPQPVLDFWAEARDEIMSRGDEAQEREMETLD
ncbi:MAG: RpiB/LacA/LacB family sugar-phosphate isomerase [candidate division WS1 bacterium]|jgi:ribose 5-phosphate isomerase B|nr:RpiB/LacA/LacB family sugar-phosphate isomerase [candidate division WS1 bacterium]